ncbi:MAG: iron ABC transporter permease [Firmicutes bacterium]|nr:iron ABC transporter permease [Bacillota bacterium]
MKKKIFSFIIVAFMLFVLFFYSADHGGIKISYEQLFHGLFIEYDSTVNIIYDQRFPRMIIAILSGASLAVSGVLFQAVLKNPLADPGIIGITSCAECVTAIVVALFPSIYLISPLLAFFGGMCGCALVYTLSYKNGFSPLRIILVGIAVDATFSGLTSACASIGGQNYESASEMLKANISLKTWNDVEMLAVYVVIGLVVSVFIWKKCNLLSLEDKAIRGLGINVTILRLFVSIVAVLLASINAAVVGTVSFVGLIVPHIGRLLVGNDHRILIPFAALCGAFTMLAADTAGRLLWYPYEISSAVVMAVVGGPFFIILLKRSDMVSGK